MDVNKARAVSPPNQRSAMSDEPQVEPMLQFFSYAHLPEPMQKVSRPFCDLAQLIVATLPRNPERTVALRKLLEAKDCGIRATIYRP